MDLIKGLHTIRNENDAYELLKYCSDGRVALEGDFEIKFEGWPVLEIRLEGEKFASTITPSIMKGLLEFQKEIYRSYALSKYNTFNLNKLSKLEKGKLEIKVKVTEGSSKLGIDFQAALEKFMTGLSERMEAKHVIIIILALATLYFGNSAYRSYLQERTETRAAQAKTKESLALIHAQQFASEQETERLKIIADIAKDNHVVDNIRTYSYDAHTGLLRGIKGADSAELQRIEISGEVADELLKNARKKAHEVRLDGKYRILVVDSSGAEGFKVKVMDTSTNDQFSCEVQDKTLDRKYIKIIQDAEWSKSCIQLTINAREVGGEIRKAVILSAQKLRDEKP